jgi:hypothetical protein
MTNEAEYNRRYAESMEQTRELRKSFEEVIYKKEIQMAEFTVRVAYENAENELKWVETGVTLKKGDVRAQAVLDVVKNGFQIQRNARGEYDFIPPHRIVLVRYIA